MSRDIDMHRSAERNVRLHLSSKLHRSIMRRGDQQKGLRGAVVRRQELRQDEQIEGLPQVQRRG